MGGDSFRKQQILHFVQDDKITRASLLENHLRANVNELLAAKARAWLQRFGFSSGFL